MSNSELSLRNIEDLRDGDRHTQLEELAVQLRQNGMEDYRTHVQCTAIMYDGVSIYISLCLSIIAIVQVSALWKLGSRKSL